MLAEYWDRKSFCFKVVLILHLVGNNLFDMEILREHFGK